jgi:seryl-tRNA synthetase
MIDIKLIRENPDIVRENIKKKFQDKKLPLVDEVIELDKKNREIIQEVETLRSKRNKVSKEIGQMMAQGKKDEAAAAKEEIAKDGDRIAELTEEENKTQEEIKKRMMVIPNIIDPSVPIGKNDTENVEIEKFGDPVVPDFEIPYHTDIMESFDGIDLDAAGRVAGNGFYYLNGRYCPHSFFCHFLCARFHDQQGVHLLRTAFHDPQNVVTGVMSFEEMDAMMYKIEGEDLYLIGTSEHSA